VLEANTLADFAFDGLRHRQQSQAEDRVMQTRCGLGGVGKGVVAGDEPKPASWGKMYQIQWLRLPVLLSSSRAVA